MNAIGRKRLLLLARKLETVERKLFDMDCWFRSGVKLRAKPGDCGTTACAAGWACTIPSFRKAGLKMDAYCNVQKFRGYSGFYAMCNFFRINREDAQFLFGNTERTRNFTPRQAARHIRKFVEENT